MIDKILNEKLAWEKDASLEDLNGYISNLQEGERLVITNCPEEMYRASMGYSTSEMKTAILKHGKEPVISPAHWKAAQDKGFESKPHFDFGTLVHWAALEPERILKELVIKPSISLNSNEGKSDYMAWMRDKLTSFKNLTHVIDDFDKWLANETQTVTEIKTIETQEEHPKLPKAADALKKIFEINPELKKVKVPKKSNAEKEAAVDKFFSDMPDEQKVIFGAWLDENTTTETVTKKTKKGIDKVIPPKLSDQYKKLEKMFPLVTVSTDDYHNAHRLAAKIKGFKEANGIEFLHTEISCWMRYGRYIIKGRVDAIGNDLKLYDIKTTNDIEKSSFIRNAEKLQYQLQAFVYLELFGADVFRWLGVEKKPPFAIAPFSVLKSFEWVQQCEPVVAKVLDAIDWARQNKIYNEPYSEFDHIEPYRFTKEKEVVKPWVPMHDPSENFTWGATNGA